MVGQEDEELLKVPWHRWQCGAFVGNQGESWNFVLFPTFPPLRGKAKETAGPSGITWSSFPLGKCPPYFRDDIGMEKWTLSTGPGCSKPIQPGFNILMFPNFFLLPCSPLSLSLAWSLTGKSEKLIKDIRVSPTNTVAEQRARTP